MITGRYITGIITAVMAVTAVAFCLTAVVGAQGLNGAAVGNGVSMEYESLLFNTDEVINIDVRMEQADWDEMLNNAQSEEYYVCDVKINGETFHNVGIRPKGNTSLSAIVADPNSERFSFKLEFDHFVEGQTCFGLDKLILNNNYADSTNMKEAVVYDMFQYIGAAASLYNYASVSLNGDYRGVYLALEGVEKSFMLRNFGTRDGELYKPDSMGFGGGKEGKHKPENMPDLSKFDPENLPDTDHFDPENLPDINHFDPENIPHDENERKGMRGGFSMGGNGADLNYTDDDPDSYSTIWEGSVSDTGDADHKRVIRALKNIGGGTDLEEYMDIDNVLRYMAVHVFSVNMDSLSGNMAHNYYLYEYDGKLSIIPWDYNLSFGGMTMGKSENAEDMVNDAIDTPFDGTRFFDALLENEQYLARYHEYLRILTEEYVLGGRFEEVYSRIRSQIDELVKTDPTAFYSYDEYEAGAQMLYNTILLRAQSVKGQLEGNIPSTDEEQRNDPSSRIDASEIDIGLMGQFSRGGPAKPAHTEE